MSRKQQNIEIEVNEKKGVAIPTWEVVIPGKQSIGIIEQVEERYHVTSTKNNHSLYSKTLESAINELLSYFTLHEK
ncbi:DUF2969 domain-containing protein [Lactobacillus sp. PV037]|uniref:DUF2969 domain-containing protein n=1 Tax=unclassified Lactobacillus TaxID=2620435 RepID=UPI00223F891A|nr:MULTISPECIES: DUF2969 domain-containing protein [unclassified Lactobacillus]QNQ82487.1 DUF2969 domain-containing protein [Lactobacillus sp. PV012]QNQ83399.1 DUF2969 domain-containing protein [Lactobacillus sp. PV037]